jgi:UDP-N-acetylmuramoyl-tripeptide--D-alanyl-D-alanine ligase
VTTEQIFRALDAELVGARPPAISGVSIDSRTLQPGNLFFAIKGPVFDGHDFLYAAFQKGAAAAVISDLRPEISASNSLLRVPDTTVALQKLAREYRRLWGKTVVAVTGSAGKTTTKTFIASVLHSRFRVFSNPGNLNNHYGLPLSLLRMPVETEVAVLEMGMSGPGEIATLCCISEPSIGVITNVQPVHLEFFGSIEEIARAKTELADYVENGGTWIYNADDRLLVKRAETFKGKKIGFGTTDDAKIRAENIRIVDLHRTDFDLLLGPSRVRVALPVAGKYFVYNFLAAVAVGSMLGLKTEDSVAAASSLSAAPMRGRVIRLRNSATVIDDSYNSNPAALHEIATSTSMLPGYSRRMAVVGEMLELGSHSKEFHFNAGQEIAQMGFDWLIGVRGYAREICEGARQEGMRDSQVRFYEDSEAAAAFVAQLCASGDLLLVKGSRGVHMEKIVERLTTQFGTTEGS